MSFRALVTEKSEKGTVSSKVKELNETDLPDGEVLVDVEWSGVNYKDGMVVKGEGRLVRDYPHVGGIDFAGTVLESADKRYKKGQLVILTGWRVGEVHWGGYAERARVKADWLVPMPKGMSAREAMMLGTAGLTAKLAITKLKALGLTKDKGEVLVTGAGGGVGTIAVMLLSRLGFQVTAATGRKALADTLTRLGATNIVTRQELLTDSGKILESQRWAGVIDTVAGDMLPNILKQLQYGGAIAAIGRAGGAEFTANIAPFLLRAATLTGIDSVNQPYEARVAAWDRASKLFVPSVYESLVEEVGLGDVPKVSTQILNGKVAGRVLVNVKK